MRGGREVLVGICNEREVGFMCVLKIVGSTF